MRRRMVVAVALAVLFFVWVWAGVSLAHDEGGPNLLKAAVYTADNGSGDNRRIVARFRDSNGLLTWAGRFPKHGPGDGADTGGLGGIVSNDGRFLFSVDTENNAVVVHAVRRLWLEQLITLPSRGQGPVSVAVSDRMVCAVNLDGVIACFWRSTPGSLVPAGRADIGAEKGPVQIVFVNQGLTLVVTASLTNEIYTVTVGGDGSLAAPKSFPSRGQTPRGILPWGVHGNLVFVANAECDGAGRSSASSYAVNPNGDLEERSVSIPSGQTGAGGVAMVGGRDFVFVSNMGGYEVGGTISSYKLNNFDGTIELAIGAAATLPTSGLGAISGTKDGFLYARHWGDIAVFRVLAKGGAVRYHSSYALFAPPTGGVVAW